MILFSENEKDRIIEMAWEDRTTFEAIKFQFQMNEQQVIELMRCELNQAVLKDGVNVYKAE